MGAYVFPMEIGNNYFTQFDHKNSIFFLQMKMKMWGGDGGLEKRATAGCTELLELILL